MTITSLATSTVSWMVTHPSIDWAHGCLTSVIRLQMVTPCQQGYQHLSEPVLNGFFLFQFCIIVDQNQNFSFGILNYTYMYQLIEKVVRNNQNFDIFQSPLDLSIILFLELKHLSKF